MTQPNPVKPPKHLAATTRRWFSDVLESYELEDHHVRILTLAGESWDRGQQARAVLDRDGLTYMSRFDEPRARPEVAIERDCRISFARLIRELGLDTEPPTQTARPPKRL